MLTATNSYLKGRFFRTILRCILGDFSKDLQCNTACSCKPLVSEYQCSDQAPQRGNALAPARGVEEGAVEYFIYSNSAIQSGSAAQQRPRGIEKCVVARCRIEFRSERSAAAWCRA